MTCETCEYPVVVNKIDSITLILNAFTWYSLQMSQIGVTTGEDSNLDSVETLQRLTVSVIILISDLRGTDDG
jgi:hypothetical protein